MQTDQCSSALKRFTTSFSFFSLLCCKAGSAGIAVRHTQTHSLLRKTTSSYSGEHSHFSGATLHLLQQIGLSQLLNPTWASQEWPLFSQSLHLQNLIYPGLKLITCPSPVPVANSKEKHGAGYDSSKGFPLPWQT